MRITAKKTTPETFARFGRVVSRPTGAPTAEAKEFKFWSNISNYLIEGETEVGLCTVYRQPTAQISTVERHLRTPEILIPVDAPFLLPLVDRTDPSRVEAFRVEIGQAVIIDDGVWHGACLPVGGEEATYFVIFRKGTPTDDVVKQPIEPVEIIG